MVGAFNDKVNYLAFSGGDFNFGCIFRFFDIVYFFGPVGVMLAELEVIRRCQGIFSAPEMENRNVSGH